MTYEKQNVDDRLRQAVTRLKSSEAQRIEALERIQVLETQLSLYVEDFNVEQRERRLSQERTLAAERQLEAALLRVTFLFLQCFRLQSLLQHRPPVPCDNDVTYGRAFSQWGTSYNTGLVVCIGGRGQKN